MANSNPTPHSWSLKEWPQDYYPNDSSKATYLVRAHRDELTAAGALVRVGRELVIIGAPYVRWMQKKGAAVHGYECPANKDRARVA
jgi:hypothetical protein